MLASRLFPPAPQTSRHLFWYLWIQGGASSFRDRNLQSSPSKSMPKIWRLPGVPKRTSNRTLWLLYNHTFPSKLVTFLRLILCQSVHDVRCSRCQVLHPTIGQRSNRMRSQPEPVLSRVPCNHIRRCLCRPAVGVCLFANPWRFIMPNPTSNFLTVPALEAHDVSLRYMEFRVLAVRWLLKFLAVVGLRELTAHGRETVVMNC